MWASLDLALGPDQALGHGGLGHQEGPGDLGGLEPAEQAQGQRHLGGGGQRRVAAGEDQAEAVVVHGSHLLRGLVAVVDELGLGVAVVARRLPAQAVDGPVAGGGDDPAAGVGRHAGGRPLLHGHRERVLDRLFGEVDVAEEADQGGDGTAELPAEGLLDLGVGTGLHD